MILLPNIDTEVWDLPERTVQIIKELKDLGSVDISLDGEGPDCNTNGLYDLLRQIANEYNVNPKNIRIYTRNQLDDNTEFSVTRSPPLYVDQCNDFVKTSNIKEKTFDKDFNAFGIFIGRLNWLRLFLITKIRNEYNDKSIYTCHYDRDNEFHYSHIGLEKMVQHNIDFDTVNECIDTLKACPIKNDIVEEYPIISPAHMNIAKVYHKFFVEIVAETYSTGKTFYPTEKIWRPILLKTPFIVQGPQNYLENLKKLGFKTFDRWWNENYSLNTYDYQLVEISKVLKEISKWSCEDMRRVYSEMEDTLEHNYNVMMNLKNEDFVEAFYPNE